MSSNIASALHVRKLFIPRKESRKGQNGILLIIAGSKQYHGASIFAGIAASRIVDLVYFCTEKENIPFLKKASPEFIVSDLSEWKKWIKKCDAVLVGPGLAESKSSKKLIHTILSNFSGKKTVLDATALHLTSPQQLHKNCIITPHAGEFLALFGQKPTKSRLKEYSKKYKATIVLKGPTDIIACEGKLYYNFTGNQGMIKGGTGDILAGLIAGFACKNKLLLSCIASCYLNGLAGDMLKKEKGCLYNAQDVLERIPAAKKSCELHEK